ncbi:hypothetical protein P8452_76575 [Trifolium repens]|nr:hypothetical protein P8452_76575 [Trifolium repens]
MAQNIVFSVILLALVIFGQSVEGRHIKYIDENNLVKNEDIVHDKHAGILDTTSAATLSPPILPPSVVGDAPPPSHGVGAFRPTTPGNSPVHRFCRFSLSPPPSATSHNSHGKEKHFQNPLRSTLQTQAPAQGPTSVAPHQVAHQGSTSTNSLPQGPTPVAPTQGPTPVDSSSAHEIPQQTQTSRQYVGRESADSWTVEAIDPQGAIKRIKLKLED